MSNTATLTKSLRGDITYINYANNEFAIIGNNSIFSLPTNSSSIAEWTYEPEEQALSVIYKSCETKRYYYEGVPMSVVFALLTADSIGSFIAREVKPNYTFRLVDFTV